MFKFKQSLMTFAGLSLLIGLIAIVTPRTGLGQKPSPAPPHFSVTVVNSESQPVPVTGTVSVANLGDVPLPVRDADNPARQPFSRTLALNFPLGSALTVVQQEQFGPYTVPAGKRLVLEDAAGIVYVPVGQKAIAGLQVIAPAGAPVQVRTVRPLTLTYQFTEPFNIPTSDAFEAGEPVRMYLEPGERLEAFAQRSSKSGSGFAELYVHGYFVDLPTP